MHVTVVSTELTCVLQYNIKLQLQYNNNMILGVGVSHCVKFDKILYAVLLRHIIYLLCDVHGLAAIHLAHAMYSNVLLAQLATAERPLNDQSFVRWSITESNSTLLHYSANQML